MNETDPYKLFDQWWKEAQTAVKFPDAMTLATADKNGKPSARIVLYKGLNEGRFLFVTNFDSRKGRDLFENPRAALVFYWQPLDRQVRIEGAVEKASEAESDSYWVTRPRDSQISAWASQQSKPLKNREELVERVEKIRAQYDGKSVPRPPFWGGFLLKPEAIEFWINRDNRLHDRYLFTRASKGWSRHILSP
jgi:pyridoxamine 5'-phosphate oxidase